MSAARWQNWVGNQAFAPGAVARPADEAAVQALVAQAARAGSAVRVAGAGHSFTPIVETAGTLAVLDAMRGVTAADAAAGRATVLPGTRIAELGDPLWEAGLALANQGDIDSQTIAGAVATGTHGSGLALQSFSGSLRGARLVVGSGDVVEVGEDDGDLLHAAQVAIGTLGVMTSLTLAVAPAYELREWVGLMALDDVLERWDELVARHRHFSFFWLPDERSAALYGLRPPAGEGSEDRCYVKICDLPEAGAPLPDAPGRARVDRAHRVYPSVFEPNFHEMEQMVPVAAGREAFLSIRELVRSRFPHCVYPVEVRFTAADDGLLSPNHGTDTAVISVSGEPGTDYWPFLRACDALLREHRARPHWGKLHFMTADRMHELFPALDRFRAIRAELDPDGIFLNDALRPLLA